MTCQQRELPSSCLVPPPLNDLHWDCRGDFEGTIRVSVSREIRLEVDLVFLPFLYLLEYLDINHCLFKDRKAEKRSGRDLSFAK